MKQIKNALIFVLCLLHLFGLAVVILLAALCSPWFLAALLFYVPFEMLIYFFSGNDWNYW